MRMERLLSVLEGEAKDSIISIETSGLLYASPLKSLKRDFGDSLVVTHLKLNSVFDMLQIKSGDRIALRELQQSLTCFITWLETMVYSFSLNSIEYLTKAVRRLPSFLRYSFYKYCNLIKYSNTNIYTLKEFEKWLENEMQQFFNPIAKILAVNDERKKGDKPLFARNNHSSSSEISKMICWCCQKDHKLTACKTFISINLEEKKRFVKEKQLCWNCLSKEHKIKDCASTTKYRIDSRSKKHHTLLHDPSFKPVNLSNCVDPIANPSEENTQNHVLSNAFTNSAFLQMIRVILKSGETSIRTNALLDTGSDATLARSDIANYLILDGVTQNLKIANAVLNQKPL